MRIILILLFSGIALFAQENWQEHLRLARYYEKANQPEEALQFYDSAWTMSGKNPQVYSFYFNYVSRSGHWKRALTISQQMYQAHPASTKYASDYLRSLIMNDQKENAISLLNRQLRKKSFRFPDLQPLANVLLQTGLFNESMEFLTAGYKKYPKQHTLLLQIASMFQSRLSFEKATEYYLLYLQKNKNSYAIVQSRILNMLDNWDDGSQVISYIQSQGENKKHIEIQSAIYLKFKKFDLAYPLLISLYNNKQKNQYNRYLQYARQSRLAGNPQFALRLLDFMDSKITSINRKNDIFLTRQEIIYETFNGTSPIDSVNEFIRVVAEKLNTYIPGQKDRALKLLINCFHYQLKDLDQGLLYANKAINEEKNLRNKEYFYLELIRMSMEKGDYLTIKKVQNKFHGEENRGEAGFYGILASYKLYGLKKASMETDKLIRQISPGLSFFNDILRLKTIVTKADSINQRLLFDALSDYYQKNVALSEKAFYKYLQKKNTNLVLSYMCADMLYKTRPLTQSILFDTAAKIILKKYPDNPGNAKLLWQLSQTDPQNSKKYFDRIIDQFPDSLEADKLRDKVRKKAGEIG